MAKRAATSWPPAPDVRLPGYGWSIVVVVVLPPPGPTRRRLQYPGPAHDDQKIIDSRQPTMPTTSRISPTVWRFTPVPAVFTFTANARIAPIATRKIPT